MANKPMLVAFFLALSFLGMRVGTSNPGYISIYWGQNVDEDSLSLACDTGNYKYINIAFLVKFGSGSTPVLNLAGHCDPGSSGTGCASLSSEIEYCQSKGIEMFLSLGGGTGNNDISSVDDANQVATYLWNNYLGGQSSSRPLGSAVLDGIDFDIEGNSSPNHYDDLAKALKSYSSSVLLSAAPQCIYPDAHLSVAINSGLFDYVWVQFYNNPNRCNYASDNVDGFTDAWNQWAQVSATKVFLGLPASPSATNNGGYIPPNTLISSVIPIVKKSEKFFGIMLWNRYYDYTQGGYSDQVKAYV